MLRRRLCIGLACRLKQRVEKASADAARQHAKADAMARAAKKNRDLPAQPHLADLERLKVSLGSSSLSLLTLAKQIASRTACPLCIVLSTFLQIIISSPRIEAIVIVPAEVGWLIYHSISSKLWLAGYFRNNPVILSCNNCRPHLQPRLDDKQH